jgi:hypothetical protein
MIMASASMEETHMRRSTLFAALMILSAPALAQQPAPAVDPTAPPPAAGAPVSGAAPPVGSPQYPGTTVGLDKVGDDGVSTKTVKAVPCSAAARETDGSTTCVGIPDTARAPR